MYSTYSVICSLQTLTEEGSMYICACIAINLVPSPEFMYVGSHSWIAICVAAESGYQPNVTIRKAECAESRPPAIHLAGSDRWVSCSLVAEESFTV